MLYAEERKFHAHKYMECLRNEMMYFYGLYNSFLKIQEAMQQHLDYINTVKHDIEKWFLIDVPTSVTDLPVDHTLARLPRRVIPRERYPPYVNAHKAAHINAARAKQRRTLRLTSERIVVSHEGDVNYPDGHVRPHVNVEQDPREPKPYSIHGY